VITSLIQDSSAIRDAFASFEEFAYFLMSFEALKLLVRVKVWVFVVQTNHEPE